ncbi:MAG: hypothetical protein ACHP7P_15830, partial [Terriglobales bacterium]
MSTRRKNPEPGNPVFSAHSIDTSANTHLLAAWFRFTHRLLLRRHREGGKPELIKGKRALVVEDGPTLTHGGMTYGAGWFAAKNAGAAEIVDAKPYAVGTIAATYKKYPNSGQIVPAMGYPNGQIADLEATINATPCDVVVEGTPIDLTRVLKVNKPIAEVTYELEE